MSYAIHYRYEGRYIGSHSGVSTLERAEGLARDAVDGVWTCADEARVLDDTDRLVLKIGR